MPWGEKTVEELRESFIKEWEQNIDNVSALCRKYSISRKTAYKWIKRYQSGGNLLDESRRPKSFPRKTNSQTEEIILTMRSDNPAWGAKKIHDILIKTETNIPSIRTVNNILKRNGCIEIEESQKHIPYKRFEKEKCNELWQADFKGDFAMQDGSRCFPLTILDDHSRFSLGIEAKSRITGVKDSFENIFRQYGMPDTLLTDNGACFAGFKGGYTQFEVWLMRLGILPIHGRIMHPQTQGKIERFHRTMKAELLRYETFYDLEEAQGKFNLWRQKYNSERPHEALMMKTPSQVYNASQHKFPDRLPEVMFADGGHFCKVNNWGYIRFQGYQIFISESFADTYLQLRAQSDDKTFQVCFGAFVVAHIDTQEGVITQRKAYRLKA